MQFSGSPGVGDLQVDMGVVSVGHHGWKHYFRCLKVGADMLL